MSRELLVVWAGRHRRDDWDGLCDRYRARIARFVKLTEVPVRSRGNPHAEHRLRTEGEAVMAAVPRDAWTVALDRQGKPRSSRDIAVWLAKRLQEWPHPLAFLIGSDLGLDEAVRNGAREQLSLGPLTLPHELAKLILYEQIYRGICITAGIKYHRDPF
jgi:23S rRNA (pseudouridine1915-N3)-methyltransferase